MTHDPNVAEPNHWLEDAGQRDKLDHVLKSVAALPPEFREIFESTPASGIKEPYTWHDLQLGQSSLPTGRVVLLGNAAHTMTPFMGEGGHHALIDALKLSTLLGRLHESDTDSCMDNIKATVAKHNVKMLQRG